jgi:hypothetical protein
VNSYNNPYDPPASAPADPSGAGSPPTRIPPIRSSVTRVLVNRLQQQGGYDALSNDHAGIPDNDIDVVIIDDRSLRAYRTTLRERTADTAAFFGCLWYVTPSRIRSTRTVGSRRGQRER